MVCVRGCSRFGGGSLASGQAGAASTANGAAKAGTAGDEAAAVSGIAANTSEPISDMAKSILRDM